MAKQDRLFFIDAETDGLYGAILSVAVIITDINCNELKRAYYGIRRTKLAAANEWTRENVVPVLGEYTEFDSEPELLEAVWSLWEELDGSAYAIGDVIYPVEAGLFRKCIELNPEDRYYKGPFPLLDISTVRYCKGLDPAGVGSAASADALSESSERSKARHNALYDVETMIREYKSLMEVGK